MVVQQTAHDGSQHQQHTVNERETSSFGPNDDNGGDDSVSTSLRIPMELDSKNTLIDGNSEKERRQPERILEHVSIIFPSAFKHISASVESHPHVTIRPLYFDTTLNNNINVGEHFLDTFLEYHPDQQWSSSSDCGSINNARRDSLLWLRRMHEVKDSTTDNLVPLSTFLLARFEWAVWESYMEFECDKNKTGRAPSATAKIMDAKGDNARRHLLSSLGDVLSHCGAMNDVSMTIDSLTLSSFVAPFLDACLPKKHPFAIATVDQVENVILTPLKWIMCGNRPGKPVNLVLLDSAVETSLERMENHAPKTELMQETVTMTLSRTSDPLIVASGNTQTVNSTPNGHSSPRKKKKKHKKKKVSGSASNTCILAILSRCTKC